MSSRTLLSTFQPLKTSRVHSKFVTRTYFVAFQHLSTFFIDHFLFSTFRYIPRSMFLSLNPLNRKLIFASFFKTSKQPAHVLLIICSPLNISVKFSFFEFYLKIHQSRLVYSFSTFRYVSCTLVLPQKIMPMRFLFRVILKRQQQYRT